MTDSTEQDVELVALAVTEAVEAGDADAVATMLRTAIQGARQLGMQYVELLELCVADEETMAEASTVDAIMGRWCDVVTKSVSATFEGRAPTRAEVFALVLEMAVGSVMTVGIAEAQAQAIVARCYKQLAEYVARQSAQTYKVPADL